MKQRILTGWTFTRGLYMGIGTLIIMQSIADKQWISILLGSYFFAMGLFAFGCASGNCSIANHTVQTKQKQNITSENIPFEEIKTD